MIQLAEPADLGDNTNVRKICLPFIAFNYPQSWFPDESFQDDELTSDLDAQPERDNNYLRNIKIRKLRAGNQTRLASEWVAADSKKTKKRVNRRTHRRRNDKFLHTDNYFNVQPKHNSQIQVRESM